MTCREIAMCNANPHHTQQTNNNSICKTVAPRFEIYKNWFFSFSSVANLVHTRFTCKHDRTWIDRSNENDIDVAQKPTVINVWLLICNQIECIRIINDIFDADQCVHQESDSRRGDHSEENSLLYGITLLFSFFI